MATPPPQPQRTIGCYMCGHRFDVSARTMSTSCPKCFNPLKVEDIVIKGPHSVRKIQTCGRILVEPKALLIAPVIQTGEGIEVQGTLEGNVATHGPVTIGPRATWKGDCKAPSLTVELGAVIHKGFFAINPPPQTPRPSDATPKPQTPPPQNPTKPVGNTPVAPRPQQPARPAPVTRPQPSPTHSAPNQGQSPAQRGTSGKPGAPPPRPPMKLPPT